MTYALLAVYWLAVLGLCVFGLNCFVLCWQFRRHRVQRTARLAAMRADYQARVKDSDLPRVTVQLPIFNERYVVDRLLDAVAQLDWPRDRLEIQVLDDSTDDTRELAAEHVARLARRGLDIVHIHRTDRTGFKAGALKAGMLTAKGDLLAIFDADFVPQRSFLRDLVPFFENPRIGLVQARWGHLNRDLSPLTRAQGLAIDGHFSVEQAGRCWAGWMLNFNGTAGIWRRQAINDAGGWQADTLTEDLDLSYRAQLAGWGVEYAVDVEVPAEIPADIAAFKSQQRRWAKGSIQTAKKLLPRVLRAPLRPTVRLQAALHLTHYLAHPLMVVIAILAVPTLLLWPSNFHLPGWSWLLLGVLMLGGTCGPNALYVTSQKALRPREWGRRILELPLLMVMGTGIAVSNTRAVIEALLGIESAFVRTPKRNLTDGSRRRGFSGYRSPLDLAFVAEAALAFWCAWGAVLYLQEKKFLVGPFLAIYAVGYGWVSVLSVRDAMRLARARKRDRLLAERALLREAELAVAEEEPGLVEPPVA
jgi:cellulose synthase/poly-beta-1,6-N-acetylglucosamine synthase-like glycosyltransferase